VDSENVRARKAVGGALQVSQGKIGTGNHTVVVPGKKEKQRILGTERRKKKGNVNSRCCPLCLEEKSAKSKARLWSSQVVDEIQRG